MNTSKDEDSRYEQQLKIFGRLIDRINTLLKRYGEHDLLKPGDYSIYDDYWGYPQVKVSINNLELLQPSIIEGLQTIVKAYPAWEIVVAVAVRGHYNDWREMGLYIRPHEIIDGLQRQYFPKEFQDIEYQGARHGTAYD